MKLSDYYRLPGVRVIAMLIGALIFAVVALLSDLLWGALIGASVVLLVSLTLPIALYRDDLPYIRIIQSIRKPLLLDERVNFMVRGGRVGGFFVLTQESMILLSLERGEYRMELARSDVRSLSLGDDMTLSIYLKDSNKYIRFLSHDTEQIYDILRQNGW